MPQSQSATADGRAQTDASLGAERASSDLENAVTENALRRGLDDLIERDRLLADLRLLKFRDRADRLLSRERFDSPSPNSSVFLERNLADECKKEEREMADALLHGERHRSDMAVIAERNELDALRVELEPLRQLTDGHLSTERDGADSTATILGLTKNALADARTRHGRQVDVLNVVAHDLRSPLSVISMTAERLAEMSPAAFTPVLASPIISAVARMERLLADLLDLARIESGTLRIVKHRLDMGQLLAEVLQSYGPMFSARGIGFTVERPAKALMLSFDHDRIVQVLSNLLGNAMKFTPRAGSVTLQVEYDVERVAFALSDTGPGIPVDALPHVFERFWQIDSDKRRGLGLGLHICENIIQAHEGRIWVESDPGHGATFRFTLPMN